MQRADLQRYDLPDAPGVYLFRDAKRKLLYVGKATSLRDRVRSYFTSDLVGARGARIVAMVERAARLEWQETGSVLEALILEAALIKKHQPPYNVDEKDDKSWNYVVITREDFPRVLLVRGRELALKWSAKQIKHTFGPFPHGGQLKEALKIVRKIFPYRDTCTPGVGKPCFNRQIGLCPGVCSGEVSKAEYATTIKHLAQLFSGNMKGLKRALAAEMKAVAANERFEDAARLRKQIAGLEHIRDVSLITDDVRTLGHDESVRIEAYDIAHTAGTETVGVMTVVENGERASSEYRKFTVREFTNNDPGALSEILSRRLAHTEWRLPRVIVMDGATAQIRVAQKVLKAAGVSIPIVGVVKDERHRPIKTIGDERMARLYEKDILLANAEAHRFAIGWHRKKLGARMVQ